MIILRQKEFKKDSIIDKASKVLTRFLVPDPEKLSKKEKITLSNEVERIKRIHEKAKNGSIAGVLVPKVKDPEWARKKTEELKKAADGYINSINK